MAERLQAWERTNGLSAPYRNENGARELERQLESKPPLAPQTEVAVRLALGNEYLNIGDPDRCLDCVTNLLTVAARRGIPISPKSRRDVRLLEGLAYLRRGELDNCIGHHNPDSCLFPISGGGQHSQRRGAEQAFKVFLDLARQRPNDYGARWLLNVSAMTLGRYPWDVPAEHLIPDSVFRSEADLPRFPELATRLGLVGPDRNGLAGGVVADDFDNDGWTDLFLTDSAPPTQSHLYRNRGDGRFEDVTVQAGLVGETGGLNVVQTDYDNDGWLDLFIVRGAWMRELGRMPNSLLRNNGDGTFSDVTEAAGLLTFFPALSVAWFDANNDGWLDVFIGGESLPNSPPHPCALFINNHDGTFTDQAGAAGVNMVAFVRGVTAGDFDNDGWPDLYVSCLDEANRLFHNRGARGTNSPARVQFEEVAAAAGVTEPKISFPTWFWDYDNDGWLDLFVSGYGTDGQSYFDANVGHVTLGEIVAMMLGQPSHAETPRLFQNTRDGRFRDVTGPAHLRRPLLTMGANFGDLDNDGYLDFYAGTGTPYFGSLLPNQMFRNDAGRAFQDVTTAGGFGHLQKGHGIAFADLNGDGHQEVIANMGGAYAGDTFYDAVFANPGNAHHWLKLKLAGTRSNRSAIGARIKVVVRDNAAGRPREIHRMVCSGGSFGASPLTQEIGLGAASGIEQVEVWWPTSGLTNRYTRLELDHAYQLTEGSDTANARATRQFPWPR